MLRRSCSDGLRPMGDMRRGTTGEKHVLDTLPPPTRWEGCDAAGAWGFFVWNIFPIELFVLRPTIDFFWMKSTMEFALGRYGLGPGLPVDAEPLVKGPVDLERLGCRFGCGLWATGDSTCTGVGRAFSLSLLAPGMFTARPGLRDMASMIQPAATGPGWSTRTFAQRWGEVPPSKTLDAL